MPSLEAVVAFAGVSMLLALAPGPDNLFVLTQSALHGSAAGLLVTLGLCTGLLVHISAVALGLAAMLQASPLAFRVVKFAGAAYLLYLAWQAFRANRQNPGGSETGRLQRGRLYVRGIVMNVTNPKVAMFFLAFLPQFVNPAAAPVTPQIMLLGGLFIAATLLVFGGIALGGATLGRWFWQGERRQRILNRIAGSVFAGLALRLITTT